MNNQTRIAGLVLAVVLLLIALPVVVTAAAPAPEYTTTYTITVKEDGSAVWQIEYRTPLESEADLTGFETYTRDLAGVYQPQVQDLMQRSATGASVAASRPMKISNLEGSAVTQLSPTGKFGVVMYTFTWEGFAKTDGGLMIGDAFFGGLYLAKDSTLVIRYPEGYSIISVDPSADQQRDNLIWYGQRSFAQGEPRVILEKDGFALIPLVIGSFAVLLGIVLIVMYRKRKTVPEAEEPDEPAPVMSAEEQKSVEDRIQRFIAANGGEQFQSDIVRALDLPRSTVSASLNSLHKKGVIIKVRKGRENLIRLVKTGI